MGKTSMKTGLLGSVLIFLCLLGLLFFITQATAQQPITVLVNGEKVTFTTPPIIESGRTLVEFRPIFEKLGLTVGWDATTKTVSGSKDSTWISLTIGKQVAVVNRNEIALEVAPKIIDGRTFVPLRFIGESTGNLVNWNPIDRVITITYDFNGQLMAASASGMINKVNELLKNNVNVNYQNKDGSTALSLTKNVDVAIALLNAGADPNIKSSNGATAVWVAVKDGKTKILQELLKAGGNPNVQTNDGMSALNLAISNQYWGIVDILATAGAKFNNNDEIKDYMIKKYSRLDTVLATIDFEIFLTEYDSISTPWDYRINFYYDIGYYELIFNNRANSVKYAQTGQADADLSRKQIRDFIEKASKDLISILPGKKIYGETRNEWYRYPNLRLGLRSHVKHSWVNFEPLDSVKEQDIWFLDYNDVKISNFTWRPELDKFYSDDTY